MFSFFSFFPRVFVVCLAVTFTFVYGAPARHGLNVAGIGSPISNADAKNIITGSYIVVYNQNVSDTAVETHQASVMTLMRKRGLQPNMRHFAMTGWRGMSLSTTDDGMLIDINNAAEVAYVEADTKVQTTALLSQANAPLGLARISHASAGETNYVFDSTAGAGIVAYVVDTGILINHTEFEGRATWGFNSANAVDTDENGHGSHVSGTIGGKTFGVAKSVSLVAVKVLDADGAGANSDTIAGLQYVLTDVAARNLSGKAVVNMSLAGSKSTALNAAVAALTKAGVTVVVAAGNDDANAGTDSPASAASAITVGAIDAATDAKASFSNFGSVVDIMAPGVDVLSVGIASTTDTEVLSGTSMGMAAYLMALEGLTSATAIVNRMKYVLVLTESGMGANKIRALANTTGAATTDQTTGTTTLIAYNGDGF